MKYQTTSEQTIKIQTEAPEPVTMITWEWLLIQIAGAVVSAAATEVFKLGVDYKKLLQDAVDEICTRINAHIDQVLIGELLGNCDHIRSDYMTYLETKTTDDTPEAIQKRLETLKGLEVQASNTVRIMLASFPRPTVLGPLGMACTLHLFLIKEMIPMNDGFKDTLKRLSTEYGDMYEKAAVEFINLIPTEVGECTGSCIFEPRNRPDDRPGRLLENLEDKPSTERRVCDFEFKHSLGRRKFSSEGAQEECQSVRNAYYTSEVDAVKKRDIAIDLANAWRNVPELQ